MNLISQVTASCFELDDAVSIHFIEKHIINYRITTSNWLFLVYSTS